MTGTGRLEMTWRGEQVVDIPPASAADEGPVYERPIRRPARQDTLVADDPAALPRPQGGPELRATLLALLASPGLADTSWVTEQYDRHVRGNTVLAMGQDAGVLRIDEQTGLGIALASTDAPPMPSGPVREPNRITLLPVPRAAASLRSSCRMTPTHSALTSGFPR